MADPKQQAPVSMAQTPNSIPMPGFMPPQQQGGVLPPTNPVNPDLAGMMQQIAQQVQMPAMEREMGIASSPQMASLSQPTPVPKMGPSIDKGAGIGHNIGQALMMLAQGTGIGRQVFGPGGPVYGPGIRGYEAGQQQKAQQLEALKTQGGELGQVGESASRAIGGLGETLYHQDVIKSRSREDAVKEENAASQAAKTQGYLQHVQNMGNFQKFLMGLDTSKLSEQERHNKVDEALVGAGIQVQRGKNDITLSLGNQHMQLATSEFDANVANKNQGFFTQILQSLGVQHFFGVDSPSPQTAPLSTSTGQVGSAAAPAASPTKPSGGKSAPKAGGAVVKWGRDAQGKPVRLSQ